MSTSGSAMAQSPEGAADWKLESYTREEVTYLRTAVPETNLAKCQDFEFREGDVLVATYPKAGTNWLGEVASLIMADADVEKCKQIPLGERCVYLEFSPPHGPSSMDRLSQTQGPRLMFTHLHPQYFSTALTQGKVKVIVVMRNPKDTLVSYFHFYRMTRALSFPGTWNEFFDLVKGKQLVYGDIFQWNLRWGTQGDLPNVKVVKYEDMKRDRLGGIRTLAQFLGHDLSEGDLGKVSDATSFNSMKANPSTNMAAVPAFDQSKGQFMRKGEVGDWKKYFTPEQDAYIHQQYEQVLKPAGIEFDFE